MTSVSIPAACHFGTVAGEGSERWTALLDLLATNGGFTAHLASGALLGTGASGYGVSVHGRRSVRIFGRPVTATDLQAFAIANGDLLALPGHYLGAWRDTTTGAVHLDMSLVIASRTEAEQIAGEHDQLAIFGFATGDTIALPAGRPRIRLLALTACSRPQRYTGA